MTRGRVLAVVLVLALIVVAFIAVLGGGPKDEPLDPASPAPTGSRALAQVLRAQGIDVTVTHSAVGTTARADADTTVLVTRAGLFNTQSLRRLSRSSADAGTLVLIAPSTPVLQALGLPIRAVPGPTSPLPVTGTCSVPPFGGLSLDAEPGSRAYSSTSGRGCVAADDGGDLVRTLPAIPGQRPAVIVLGSDSLLRNGSIRNGDDAAFALRALGAHRSLSWVAVDPAHADANPVGEGDASPWPRWSVPALVLISVTVVLLMFWRGRRLGPLVTEPLPVVVPAVETTLSRGQLYRRARDTARTAEVLRIGSRHRIARYLGLSPTTDPARLSTEAARAAARDPAGVRALLVGAPVLDDDELVRTAKELQTLERQVRRT